VTQKTFNVQIFEGATEFIGSATNLVKLFDGATEYVGNSEASGNFTYQGGAGIFGISMNEFDSGVYTVKKSVNGGTDYTTVVGLDPVPILMKNMLMLAGGTMEGTIAMGNKSITGVSSLSFNGAAANLHGIEVGNLLDKSATEEVTGEWTHSGKNTFTGIINVESASRLQIAGVALDDSLTANDLNMARGLYSASAKLLTNTRSFGVVQKKVTGGTAVTLSAADAGVIYVNTTDGMAGITMPLMSKDNAGSVFIIYIYSHIFACTITMKSPDLGFSVITGAATSASGSIITLNEVGAFVIIMNSGVPSGYWSIIGANAHSLA